MIGKFAKEIVSFALLFTFKNYQAYEDEKGFFLISISRPGIHLWHTLCSPENPLQCIQQQLLDFNSLNINLLGKFAYFGHFLSSDILEKYIFLP